MKPQLSVVDIIDHSLHSSDIHIQTGQPIRVRTGGALSVLHLPPMDNQSIQAMLFDIISVDQQRLFLHTGKLDFLYGYSDEIRFRVNYFLLAYAPAAIFRRVP